MPQERLLDSSSATMIRPFLRESTIHGLKYLDLCQGWVERLLWSICITSSLVTASIIVYLNVLNWQRSPVVVTNIEEYGILVRFAKEHTITRNKDLL